MRTCNEESLGRLIYHTAQDLRKMAEKILYPYDLTVEQMHLLKNMSVDAGITQKARTTPTCRIVGASAHCRRASIHSSKKRTARD